MSFFKNVLATILGLFTFSFLAFILIIIILSAASSDDGLPEVKSNSVLLLKMSGVLSERVVEDPIAKAFGNAPSQLGLFDALKAIKAAKDDDRIKGIYINPMFMQAGQASLLELRNALVDFKKSGKFVYAYSEFMSESDYMVASVADSLIINPEGFMELNGLSVNVTFLKGMFDKLDIEPEIFRVGQYKSAVEPLMRKTLSEDNKRQIVERLESMNKTYLTAVSENLNQPFASVKEASDQMLVRNPKDAERLGLITKAGYEDEIKDLMRSELGLDAKDAINFISVKKYAKTVTESYSSAKIAVIVANGEITAGSPDDAVGGDQFANEIRKAREDDGIKAIVLRINSPGGSVTASEQIWRELMLTKGIKPIIASMGNVAASGGYYIAAPCDTILAQPNTITGSIGIFSVLFNFGDFLENKTGITNESVGTGQYSDIFTVTRSLSPAERAIFQNRIERGYDTFITRVSDGRNMSKEDVLNVASGRVWTGEQAKEVGLVDILGSYDDAIQLAAEKAGISDDYLIRYYPEKKDFFEQLVASLEEMDASVLGFGDNAFTPYLNKIEELRKMKGPQARMIEDIEVN